MTNRNWIIIGIIALLIGGYFAFIGVRNHYDRYNILEGNNQVLKENVVFYKSQLADFKKKEDSLNNILTSKYKEIDSLKGTYQTIFIDRDNNIRKVEGLPNTEMQAWFERKVKQLQNKKK